MISNVKNKSRLGTRTYGGQPTDKNGGQVRCQMENGNSQVVSGKSRPREFKRLESGCFFFASTDNGDVGFIYKNMPPLTNGVASKLEFFILADPAVCAYIKNGYNRLNECGVRLTYIEGCFVFERHHFTDCSSQRSLNLRDVMN